MPLPKSLRGRLLLIESVVVVVILASLAVYDEVSSLEVPIGPISVSDNVMSSPLLEENYSLISTGKITGLHDGSGWFTYDAGVFVSNNSTISRTAGSSSGIPIQVSAWLLYGTTRNLTSYSGYIQYESINVSFMSSYQYFEGESGLSGSAPFHADSYATSNSGIYNSTRTGGVTTRESTVPFKGTPNPEENVLVNRTYSSTLPYETYSYGISVPGHWILSQGAQNTNSFALSITEKIGVVDAVSSGVFGETLQETHIVLNTVFLVNYTPNLSTWHNGAEIAGGFHITKLGGSAGVFISSITNSTVKKSYF